MSLPNRPVLSLRQAPEPVERSGPSVPLLRSEELFDKRREILIEHAGSFYRLRLTHSNKLILTK